MINKIARGKVEDIYVSVHGDIASPGKQQLLENAKALMRRRTRGAPLNIIYDASSADVWGDA
ncbi:MAG TPA: hypothetical protein ENI74_07210 [Gammaproteobacteria bacterium]|nr:hypothetical protein [Gammaproteobacteria bacterium]